MPDFQTNADVFGIDTRIGGAWALDGAVIDIEDGEALVVTSLDITYNRVSQKFSPLNQKRKYLAIGEATGKISLGMVVAPNNAIIGFLNRYSKACELKENTIKVTPAGIRQTSVTGGDCSSDRNVVYFECTGCIIESLNIRVQQSGGAMTVVNAGITMAFIALKIGPTPQAA